MRISVVCCVYNGAAFLRPQLDSIVAQTLAADELVIVDDGSVDGSARIIEAFVAKHADARTVVHAVNDRNLGLVANFEKAIGLATGELIFLADQDDQWCRDKISRMAALFDDDPALDFAFTDARLVDANGAPLPHSLFEALEYSRHERRLVGAGDTFTALLRRNLATGATCAFRRRVFDRAMPFPAEWIHDEWLCFVAAASGRVACLEERLIDYRQHANNQIGMRRLTLIDKWRRLFVPRAQRYAKMQRRMELLVAKLQALGPLVAPAKVDAARDKLAHVRVRCGLAPRRLKRLVPVLQELAKGRYARYSSGFRGVARDLTEPA